jgi:hypothetical protein
MVKNKRDIEKKLKKEEIVKLDIQDISFENYLREFRETDEINSASKKRTIGKELAKTIIGRVRGF